MPTYQMCVLRIAGDLRKDHPTGSRAHGEFSENAIKCSFSFHLLNRHSAPHHPHPGQPPIRLFIPKLTEHFPDFAHLLGSAVALSLLSPHCLGILSLLATFPLFVRLSHQCPSPLLHWEFCKGSGHSCPCGPCSLTGVPSRAWCTQYISEATSPVWHIITS